ncbi:MAG: hypothetical protein H0U86_14285 [Chloroflexi bacterium]|nr:hypothetical protein [Chloroflexota bacterium]
MPVPVAAALLAIGVLSLLLRPGGIALCPAFRLRGFALGPGRFAGGLALCLGGERIGISLVIGRGFLVFAGYVRVLGGLLVGLVAAALMRGLADGFAVVVVPAADGVLVLGNLSDTGAVVIALFELVLGVLFGVLFEVLVGLVVELFVLVLLLFELLIGRFVTEDERMDECGNRLTARVVVGRAGRWGAEGG